jgi:hypothetical protein
MTKSILTFVASVLLVDVCGCSTQPISSDSEFTVLTFDGASADLKTTQIVPTLDAPIKSGQNSIWCASFLAAWKTLAQDVAKEPISLNGSQDIIEALNGAADVRADIPAEALYTAAGWKQKGIVERIRRELTAKFPTKSPPSFAGSADDSFIAYAYLQARVKFKIPYFQNDRPLEFTDSSGRTTIVNSFGIRAQDEYAYFKLRGQPRILFRTGGARDKDLEFAVDLCEDSSPSQIVVARINREPTLAAALARVDKELKSSETAKKADADRAAYLQRVGPNDVLLVPDLFWKITHRFSELEGRRFTNAELKGQRLDVAQQEIQFRLDRSGAELESEAKIMMLPIPTYFILDRPFLIYMKKRDAKSPYFVMWVDNADLLTPWNGAKEPD